MLYVLFLLLVLTCQQILLGDRAHLIEFPSILLPPGATAGSIVNIAVHQNHAAEEKRDKEFWELQQEIMEEFGVSTPVGPELKVRMSLLLIVLPANRLFSCAM